MKKKLVSLFFGLMAVCSPLLLTGCDQSEEVVIYSNADDEARHAMQSALDRSGFEGKYILCAMSTAELGGKIMAEGRNMEADLLTASSYYLDTAQDQHKMFQPLTFARKTLQSFPDYTSPISVQEGSIILNTQVLTERGLPRPASFKDLAKSEYKGMISLPNLAASSTAWLMIQAILDAYGEKEGGAIYKAIVSNAGPHMENSGSAPLKKVRAGEVAVAFGLRHQAVADKIAGMPIDYVDPLEGNFSLTEGVAVLDKGDRTKPLAMQMAEAIIRDGRAELIKTYPVTLYEGEQAPSEHKSAYPRQSKSPLTVDLLRKHQEFVRTNS